MRRHLSVVAENPRDVADFLAQLMGGVTIDLPASSAGYLVLPSDGRGGAVGVYPTGSVAASNAEEMGCAVSIRAAISAEAVEALAVSRGWGCFDCGGDGRTRTVEVWVEDSWLVEVSAPAAKAQAGFASAAA